MKPSQLRKKEDLQLVISIMRQNNFASYEEKFNPFTEGIRKERFERYYRREQQSFLRVDRDWKDLCEVYGFPYERPTA
jgi:hypothetical protein